MARREIINKVFNSEWFVIIIGIIILAKTFLFYNNTIAISEPLEISTMLGTFSFIIVIVCFLCVLPNKVRILVTILVDFLTSVLLFGDHIYYIFSNNVLSVTQIANLQYGEEIIGTLPMVIQLRQIVYFFDMVVLLVLGIGKIVKWENKERSTKKQVIAKVIIGIVGISILVIIGVNYIEKAKVNSYNKDLQIREATIFGYHIADIENAFTMKQRTKYKNYENMEKDYIQLKEKYHTKYGEEMYSLQGILEGKNIIILQLESVQEFVINKEIDGKQITPNLNQFLSDNIEVTNMHMQSYSTTADSEHSTITSMYQWKMECLLVNILQIPMMIYLRFLIKKIIILPICMGIIHIFGIEEMYMDALI